MYIHIFTHVNMFIHMLHGTSLQRIDCNKETAQSPALSRTHISFPCLFFDSISRFYFSTEFGSICNVENSVTVTFCWRLIVALIKSAMEEYLVPTSTLTTHTYIYLRVYPYLSVHIYISLYMHNYVYSHLYISIYISLYIDIFS